MDKIIACWREFRCSLPRYALPDCAQVVDLIMAQEYPTKQDRHDPAQLDHLAHDVGSVAKEKYQAGFNDSRVSEELEFFQKKRADATWIRFLFVFIFHKKQNCSEWIALMIPKPNGWGE